MKKFTLSDDRIDIVKKIEGCLTVVVKQKDSDVKFAEFTPNRCIVLLVCMLNSFIISIIRILHRLCLCRFSIVRMIVKPFAT